MYLFEFAIIFLENKVACFSLSCLRIPRLKNLYKTHQVPTEWGISMIILPSDNKHC